jgi:large subunit ribosomal protein L10e
MAKLRKFIAYRSIERPYTRISKFNKKNFVRGGFPNLKIVKFDLGTVNGEYNCTISLIAKKMTNVRHNALEAARLTSNKLLNTRLGKAYHLRIKTYPHHILRENPLASGAGADRMSTGMKKSFGKIIGAAARVREGQAILELKVDKANLRVGKEALIRASKKLPCSCKLAIDITE